MNILLINPPSATKYPQQPTGLATIASVLEKSHDVKIVDMITGFYPYLIKLYEQADIVGISANIKNIYSAGQIAKMVKSVNPKTRIILGGPFGTLLPQATMEAIPEIDMLIRGEGEFWALSMIVAFGSPSAMPGISYRHNGEIRHNPAREEIADINEYTPAYHLLPMMEYKPHPPRGRAKPYAMMVTSRGCPYQCTFCAKPIFGNQYRSMTPAKIVGEIAKLRLNYGIKEIGFYDDIFNIDSDRVVEFCTRLRMMNSDIIWTCESRVSLVDENQLGRMQRAGCYAVAYGIESGSQRILDLYKKNIENRQVEEAIIKTKEAGMETIGYFMIGAPGETLEDVKATVDFAKRLPLDYAQFAVTLPYPGTELYDNHVKAGLEDAWKQFALKPPDECVTPIFENIEVDRARIYKSVQRAYRQFYIRPGYFLRRLLSGDIILNIKGAMMLLENYLL